ncbi:MAG: DinB family protein, partial [Rhodococcus fascians]
MSIEPDRKNWAWVLDRACPECGFDSASILYDDVPNLLRNNARSWSAVLTRPTVRQRPDPSTWSDLEYAAHVRDAHRIFAERLQAMLAYDAPEFADWDQDATAVERRYGVQAPTVVASELVSGAETVAAAFAAVAPDRRSRTGRRSDGSVFTVESLARYFVHDPVHHL